MDLVAKAAAAISLLFMVSVDQEFEKGPDEQFWFRLRWVSARWWLGLLGIFFSVCNLRSSPCGASAQATLRFLIVWCPPDSHAAYMVTHGSRASVLNHNPEVFQCHFHCILFIISKS